MDDEQQDTEVFESPRDPASGVEDAGGSAKSAAEAAWDAVTNLGDSSPSGGDGPAGGGQSGGGGSTDPWDVTSAGASGGIVDEYERQEANRLPIDDTPPTGVGSSDMPDDGIPPDAEIFIGNQ